jgi:endonuclease III
MSRAAIGVREAIDGLREHYGTPTPLPTSDPFELVLWENAAYLASPAKRRDAFALLKQKVGTRPADILAAGTRALESVTAHGILKDTFAGKLRECARIALEDYDGDLGAALRGSPDTAKRVLRSFPGIGGPGAEKILLFSGRHAFLAPESNGLRVLVRLGLVREDKSYARTYAAARAVAAQLPQEPRAMQEVHLLLQQHGQTLCKRSLPRCGSCFLAAGCAWARRERHEA